MIPYCTDETCEAEGVPVRCLQQGMNFRVEFARREAVAAGDEQVNGSDGSVNDRINEVCGSIETAGQMSVEGLQGQMPVPVNVPVNERDLTSEEREVLWEIQIDPTITHKRLAATLGASDRTMRRRTISLREKGFIRRVGSDKTGHWQVLKPIDGNSSDNA